MFNILCKELGILFGIVIVSVIFFLDSGKEIVKFLELRI